VIFACAWALACAARPDLAAALHRVLSGAAGADTCEYTCQDGTKPTANVP
jgi:hypothetical protein